jgi:hypothetical protein
MSEELKTEKLPEIVKGRWGKYYLVKRTDDVAIYSKDFEAANARCFEVFLIKKIDAKKAAESFKKRFGTEYDIDTLPDFREKYPRDEDFGKIAWTYPTLELSKIKFDSIINELEIKREENERT